MYLLFYLFTYLFIYLVITFIHYIFLLFVWDQWKILNVSITKYFGCCHLNDFVSWSNVKFYGENLII